MSAEAVRDGVEKHRSAALSEDLLLAAEGVDDGERIVAVDALGMHLVGVHTSANTSDELHAHGFTDWLSAHPIKIVHAVEHDRQAATERFVP